MTREQDLGRQLGLLFSAANASSPMHADYAPTSLASPAGCFLGDKFSDAEFLNIPKVFDHAHMIFGAIAFVQMLQGRAGEVFAGKAKSFVSTLKPSAILNFAPGNTNRFFGIK
jgi:hypothetical protein